MKYSFIVPCYNEKNNLEKLVKAFTCFCKKSIDFELILVNNGSTDCSAEVLEHLEKEYSFVVVDTVEINKGYGYGILHGLKRASGDYLGWIHADLQFEPFEFYHAIKNIEENQYPEYYFSKGLRKKRPMVDTMFTMGMSAYETLLLRVPLWDINAQPVLFSRKFYESWKNPPYDFSLDLYAYYRAKKAGCKFYRFPVMQHQREEGESSWNTGMSARFKLIKRVLAYSKTLKNRGGLSTYEEYESGENG